MQQRQGESNFFPPSPQSNSSENRKQAVCAKVTKKKRNISFAEAAVSKWAVGEVYEIERPSQAHAATAPFPPPKACEGKLPKIQVFFSRQWVAYSLNPAVFLYETAEIVFVFTSCVLLCRSYQTCVLWRVFFHVFKLRTHPKPPQAHPNISKLEHDIYGYFLLPSSPPSPTQLDLFQTFCCADQELSSSQIAEEMST